jgi:teichuronic acid biosynthesis glycosyltransferase TuaC
MNNAAYEVCRHDSAAPARTRCLRVLLLTGMHPHAHSNSDGVAVARQKQSLQELGLEVDLLHCRPRGRWQWFSTLFALRRAVRSGHYDLVHGHFGLRTTLLALCQPLPLVVTYHGSDINGYPRHPDDPALYSPVASAAARLTRQLSRRADAVVVMTADMKQRLPAAVQAKTSVVPMGVDTDLFRQHPMEEARARLGWGAEPVVVFCDHGGKSVKRADLARAAVHEAQRLCPDLTLFVLQGVEPAQVPLVLSAANCLLVTSDREGSPNVVRESLACNLPVVSVPVGDVPELLAAKPESGRIVPRDPVLLGRAIAETIDRPRPMLADLMSGHSLEATAQRIVGIYESVLQRRPQMRESIAAQQSRTPDGAARGRPVQPRAAKGVDARA